MSTPDPAADRRCSTGRACRGYEVHDGHRVPALLTTPHGMCNGCQRAIQGALRAFPGVWCKLELTLGETRSAVTGGRRPKPGSRVPLNTATDELMGWIVTACDHAGTLVAAELHTTWPRRRHDRRTPAADYRIITAAAQLAGPNVPTMIAANDYAGIAVAKRLLDLYGRAKHHLGETRQQERQHLPCPSCGAQALVREVQDRRGWTSGGDGSATPEVIRCLACDGGPNRDGTWTETEYTWLAQMVLSEREEMRMTQWLIAEARWQRDVAAWLAAERAWVLDLLAAELDTDADTIVRRAVAVAAEAAAR